VQILLTIFLLVHHHEGMAGMLDVVVVVEVEEEVEEADAVEAWLPVWIWIRLIVLFILASSFSWLYRNFTHFLLALNAAPHVVYIFTTLSYYWFKPSQSLYLDTIPIAQTRMPAPLSRKSTYPLLPRIFVNTLSPRVKLRTDPLHTRAKYIRAFF